MQVFTYYKFIPPSLEHLGVKRLSTQCSVKESGAHTSPTSALVASGLNLWATFPTVMMWVALGAFGVFGVGVGDADAVRDANSDIEAEIDRLNVEDCAVQ
jgi:hypothetical protein